MLSTFWEMVVNIGEAMAPLEQTKRAARGKGYASLPLSKMTSFDTIYYYKGDEMSFPFAITPSPTHYGSYFQLTDSSITD